MSNVGGSEVDIEPWRLEASNSVKGLSMQPFVCSEQHESAWTRLGAEKDTGTEVKHGNGGSALANWMNICKFLWLSWPIVQCAQPPRP